MPTPSLHAAAATSWPQQARARLATLWWLKMGSNVAGLAVFFIAYFWVLHHPQFAVTVMPLTWLDHQIAFEPAAMPLYVSLWVYVSLPLALLKDRRELASYGVATLALSVIGLAIFIAWPTAVPAFGVDWSRYPSVAFLKAVDLAGNACPSLHVAFAAFSAVWLDRQLREMNVGVPARVLNAAWCIGIVYSTLATRQHVALDALAGALLGLVVAALQLHGLRHLERQLARVRPPSSEGLRPVV
ncbi:MAG: phosphatase PAP2 family protein [Burkholderiales bacterium]|nr:phosphatase PAP2 family protein [Burkholderiales bacterium]MDE2626279.1 phosphatase PAP2 family protein [Burkholderiales bacterium]